MASATKKGVTYRPALLPGGGVSLRRALAFTALVQQVMQDKVDAEIARAAAEVDALASAAPAPAEAAVAEADATPAADAAADTPEPRTFDEFVGNVPVGTDPAAEAPHLRSDLRAPTGFEVFEACVSGDYGPRFAAVCVEAVEADGTVRPVTEAEAARDDFPAAPFAAALYDFWEASAPLMGGLQNTRPATASGSATTEAT